MPAERTPLAAAAARKHQSALQRARAALAALHDAGAEVTFQSVAAHAGVSRQWLYKNAELRAEVEKLRARQNGPQLVPAAQRTTDASLRQRNLMLLKENKRLRRENGELKQELANVLGERRTIAPSGRNRSGA
jgi:regulator of replication initiation timing